MHSQPPFAPAENLPINPVAPTLGAEPLRSCWSGSGLFTTYCAPLKLTTWAVAQLSSGYADPHTTKGGFVSWPRSIPMAPLRPRRIPGAHQNSAGVGDPRNRALLESVDAAS
ncbi:hypothetical protein HMPREF0724_10686 [Prescottella equi ATCC 33707]|uniref:Uncharacterized protein n=1 Tax=Prescottella equi ATCC 33707 TaxID=525370 RepID=E9SX35_RHOHA|nr:hypothetical protein HMPREF0724_10686 [Prescottella equi ATCC 33707]